jgi:hypothetical protein
MTFSVASDCCRYVNSSMKSRVTLQKSKSREPAVCREASLRHLSPLGSNIRNDLRIVFLGCSKNLPINGHVAADTIEHQQRRIGRNYVENIWKVRLKAVPLRAVEADPNLDLVIHGSSVN